MSRACGRHSALGLGLTRGASVAQAPEPHFDYLQYFLLNQNLSFSLRNWFYAFGHLVKMTLSIYERSGQKLTLSNVGGRNI